MTYRAGLIELSRHHQGKGIRRIKIIGLVTGLMTGLMTGLVTRLAVELMIVLEFTTGS